MKMLPAVFVLRLFVACLPVLRAQEPIITAESAILFDANTGKVILQEERK